VVEWSLSELAELAELAEPVELSELVELAELSELAEHRPARHETDSECSRYSPGADFLVGQPGSLVAMTQRREPRAKCWEGLE
jgi:hypothetical protein